MFFWQINPITSWSTLNVGKFEYVGTFNLIWFECASHSMNGFLTMAFFPAYLECLQKSVVVGTFEANHAWISPTRMPATCVRRRERERESEATRKIHLLIWCNRIERLINKAAEFRFQLECHCAHSISMNRKQNHSIHHFVWRDFFAINFLRHDLLVFVN